jgi:hypothetical protein
MFASLLSHKGLNSSVLSVSDWSPPLCAPLLLVCAAQMADVMETDELTPEQEADLAAIRARKKQIVTAHRIKKGVANNR